MKFLKKYDLFLEMKKKDVKKVYKYGCVMLYFKIPTLDKILSEIEDSDVYDKKGFGVETTSHVTLLYGLHDDEIKDSEIFDIVMDKKYPDLFLVNPSLFENSDEYDVLKFDIKYPDKNKVLHEINKELMVNFPYTTDFPKYHPHCTIAYLKKGEGKKYVKKFKDYEIKVHPNKIVYSKSDGDKISKYLKK